MFQQRITSCHRKHVFSRLRRANTVKIQLKNHSKWCFVQSVRIEDSLFTGFGDLQLQI